MPLIGIVTGTVAKPTDELLGESCLGEPGLNASRVAARALVL